jgi:hypothetical protein
MTPEEREIEQMRGYTVRSVKMEYTEFWIIVSPAGRSYVYIPKHGCDCGSRERPCKHERMVRRLYSDAFAPAKVRRSLEDVEREMAIDYPP